MVLNRFKALLCNEAREFEVTRFWGEEDFQFKRETPSQRVAVPEDWEQIATTLFRNFAMELLPRWQEAARLGGLEREVFLLKARVQELEAAKPIWVPVQTFAPEPYEVLNPFHVV